MQIVAKVLEVGAVGKQEWTDRETGEMKSYQYCNVKLQTEGNTIFCKVSGESLDKFVGAQVTRPMNGKLGIARIGLYGYEYDTQDGKHKCANDIRLYDFQPSE